MDDDDEELKKKEIENLYHLSQEEINERLKKLQADQFIEQSDMIEAGHNLLNDYSKWKIDHRGRYDHNGDTLFIEREKKKEVDEKIIQDNLNLQAKHQKELSDFFNALDKPAEEEREEQDIDDTVIHAEEEKPDQEIKETYTEAVTRLKNEREAYMRDHFDELAGMALDPSVKDEQAREVIDRNNNYLELMAQNHYKQLLDHPDNPSWKQSLDKVKKEQEAERQRQLEVEKQQQLEQQKLEQQQREQKERWDRVFGQQQKNGQDITQKRGHRF